MVWGGCWFVFLFVSLLSFWLFLFKGLLGLLGFCDFCLKGFVCFLVLLFCKVC